VSLSNRYTPSHSQASAAEYGYDYSAILPPGTVIAACSLAITYNTVPPTAQSDFQQSPVTIKGRRVYAGLAGGQAGRDYRIRWNAYDNHGNTWPRTALLLCADTS